MNQGDVLFYSDLVYHVRRLANIITEPDIEREKRIIEREKDIVKKDTNGCPTYFLSNFTIALFTFTLIVSRKANSALSGPSDLYRYPELVKETIKEFYLKVSEDYSETPGGRYIDDGLYSGEDFRDNVLEPNYLRCISNGHRLVVDLDGGYGYSTGFLEETFGGMIRKGYHCKDILENILLIYNEEPERINEIITYMQEEEARLTPEDKKVKSFLPPKNLCE